MNNPMHSVGRFGERYAAFLETVASERARLHRYAARMTGSVLDGEDVMQEALFEAYRKLDRLENDENLRPWLHKIVHNRCIDFIRSRTIRRTRETAASEPDLAPAVEVYGHGVCRALERLVLHLPPKERACVLLKDVFDYELEEISRLVGSTVGGVKAALHRGRQKLSALPEAELVEARPDERLEEIHALYLDRFNRQDWDGLRELISADARLLITDLYAGPAVLGYFTRFDQMPHRRRLIAGTLDGAPVLVLLGGLSQDMTPTAVIRLKIGPSGIVEIRHYTGCPWLIAAAESLVIEDRPDAPATLH